MDKLKKIKDNFEGCFDVKYRDIKTILGDATLIFIDDLNGIYNTTIKRLWKS